MPQAIGAPDHRWMQARPGILSLLSYTHASLLTQYEDLTQRAGLAKLTALAIRPLKLPGS